MSFPKRIVPIVLILLIAVLIRTPFLSNVPSSPYWDETILGYDAYSLAETGKDHHGTSWPIVALESYGDWKPAGYVYAAIPAIKLFGLEIWTLRLPSLLAGLAIVCGVALFARKLAIPSWIGALVVALSPWAIHFSRAAWESHLATAYITWAMYCAVCSIKDKSLHLGYTVSSVLLFIAAWYTYHAARLIVPLLIIGLLLYAFSQIKKTSVRSYLNRSKWTVVTAILLVLIGVLPLLLSTNSQSMTQRFSETSIFSDPSVIERSNYSKELSDYSVISRVIYHRYLLWAQSIATAYLDNLNPAFLFLNGEENLRHTTYFAGLFYPFEALFLLVGAYVWLRKRKPIHFLLLYWFFVALIPSALSTPTPHALRILSALPVLSLLIAQGLSDGMYWFQRVLTQRYPNSFFQHNSGKTAVLFVIMLYSISFGVFWYNYTTVYPQIAARFWQDGYEQMLVELQNVEELNPDLPVYITRAEGRPAAFLWFFRKIDPRQVQAADELAEQDQGEYLDFQKYRFVRSPGEIADEPAIIVLSQKELALYQMTRTLELLQSIESANGEKVWSIAKQ